MLDLVKHITISNLQSLKTKLQGNINRLATDTDGVMYNIESEDVTKHKRQTIQPIIHYLVMTDRTNRNYKRIVKWYTHERMCSLTSTDAKFYLRQRPPRNKNKLFSETRSREEGIYAYT